MRWLYWKQLLKLQAISYLWAFRNQSLFSLQSLQLLFPKIQPWGCLLFQHSCFIDWSFCFLPNSEPSSWLILAVCIGFMILFDSHALTLPSKTPLYSLATAAQWELWSISDCWNCCWFCNLSLKCTSCVSCPLQGRPPSGEKKDLCLSSGKEKIVRK